MEGGGTEYSGSKVANRGARLVRRRFAGLAEGSRDGERFLSTWFVACRTMSPITIGSDCSSVVRSLKDLSNLRRVGMHKHEGKAHSDTGNETRRTVALLNVRDDSARCCLFFGGRQLQPVETRVENFPERDKWEE